MHTSRYESLSEAIFRNDLLYARKYTILLCNLHKNQFSLTRALVCNREWEVAIWKDFSLIYLFLRENKKEETSPAWLNGEAARQKCHTIFVSFFQKRWMKTLKQPLGRLFKQILTVASTWGLIFTKNKLVLNNFSNVLY